MILVVGGTGMVGQHVISGLRAAELPVRALVRQAPQAPIEGVQYVIGDAADRERLSDAFDGVSRCFLSMGNGPRQEALELAIVSEAARVGAEHVVKLSAPVVEQDVPVEIARMHFRIEQAIRTSGLRATMLRPYSFMQNLLNLAEPISSLGMFFGITGDAPINMVDARDIADVAVHALSASSESCASEFAVVVLTGPEAVTHDEVARRLTELGRPTRYVNQSVDQYRRGLRRADLPDWLADHLVEIQQMSVHRPEAPTDHFRVLMRRPERTLDDFLREHIDQFASSGMRSRVTSFIGSRAGSR